MKIIITSGPTEEQIDAVMKVGNMSTGALGSVIAETFLKHQNADIDKIYYVSTKMAYKPLTDKHKIEFVTVESTQDLLVALERIFATDKIDIIIHSAAVGDYKGKYAIRAEDLVNEIWESIQTGTTSKESLMNIFENPACVCNSDTKISSYEPHLMAMFELTPKVIGRIKQMAPDVKLVGFKLLEGVSKDELFQVADNLRRKNQADYIVANDLAQIGNGRHWAIIIGANGIETECFTKTDIALSLEQLLFCK